MDLTAIEAKAFVPAIDFAASKQFYLALGFEEVWSSDDLTYIRHGNVSFLLQAFDQPAFVKNFQMHLLVENVDDWHAHVLATSVVRDSVCEWANPRTGRGRCATSRSSTRAASCGTSRRTFRGRLAREPLRDETFAPTFGADPACALVESVIPADVCARWLGVIDAAYVELQSNPAIAGSDWSQTSSSLRCRAVPQIDLATAWRAIAEAGVFEPGATAPGSHPACDLDECWVRRQYAVARRPARHAPHGWHQDGALGADFVRKAGQSEDAVGLLDMLTVWIALTPCGVDAPGLELITGACPGLVDPADLTDSRIAERFAADAFWRPAMAPGDALVFRGDVIHRTHVSPSMRRDRSSIELRFFDADALPVRLGGDRFVRVG